MKVFLFNSESGLFEGETFEETANLNLEEGITTIPPPVYENGQVAVFDRQRQAWEVITVGIARQLLASHSNGAEEK